ncbi:MAG TPA: MarR family transcriptional regulator [Xanthobacteraceae bacterium]|jgi:DNA-binding MarR family transcriptional regulator
MVQPNLAARETERRDVPVPAATAGAVDFGPLANWIGFHLRLAQNASFQAFARRANGIDLRPGRFATLMLIGRNPGISQTALSRANRRDKSSLTPVLNDLARRKLIKRARDTEDRRSYRLMLTPAGEATLAKLTECAKEHERRLDELLGARDRDRFLEVLRRLIAGLPARGNGHSR